MEQRTPPWERASQQGAWYDDQPFDVGARVAITDPAEQAVAGASAGKVVGYDAAGPRPGESFYRVLVIPDRPGATIVALPPAALLAEDVDAERLGLAQNLLLGFQQSLPPPHFAALLRWLTSDACAALLSDPGLTRQRIRAGGLTIPGLLLPDLVRIAREQLAA